MVDLQKDLAIKYPYLFPITEQLDEYYGYIELFNGKTSEFSLKVPNYPMATDCSIEINESREILDKINIINKSNLNLLEYLNQISDILQISVPTYHTMWKNFGTAYDKLINELSSFEEDPLGTSKWNLMHSNDASKIYMSMIDQYGQDRNLILDINLNVTDDKFYTVSKHNLPEEVSQGNNKLFDRFESLRSVYEKFCQTLKKLENFIFATKTLDDLCWVLDPKKPNGSENYRVIVVAESDEDKVYMTVTFNPWRMERQPKVVICGNESLSKPILDSIRENMNDDNNWWDPGDVAASLQRLLNVPFFPTAPTSAASELEENSASQSAAFECAICFLGFDNQPSVACTSKCKSYYHIQCLCTWFRSTNGTVCFNMYQGSCPNCEKTISFPLPEEYRNLV